jgi:6-phosphogluconolactonase
MSFRLSLAAFLLVAAFTSVQAQERYRVYLGTYTGKVSKGGSTAETVVHPSGKFVYVSNRAPYNSIAIFSINQQTRELTAVGHQGIGVNTPRNFAIEPTGQYMLVANQSGGNVIVFRINQSTGELTPTKASVQVPTPVCVRFMEIK